MRKHHYKSQVQKKKKPSISNLCAKGLKERQVPPSSLLLSYIIEFLAGQNNYWIKTTFPSPLTVRCGQITKFWPMWYGQKKCVTARPLLFSLPDGWTGMLVISHLGPCADRQNQGWWGNKTERAWSPATSWSRGAMLTRTIMWHRN